MTFPSLKIGDLVAEIPVIQGGMAIRISTAPLAAAVANCGGVGVIAASGMLEDELRSQIRLARNLIKNKSGILAVNIMFAASEFMNLAKIAVDEAIDMIIFGAGFSRDIFTIGREANVPIVPIVSSAKLAKISKSLGASAIIVESGEAGGHLGTEEPIRSLIPEIRKALDSTKSFPGIDHVPLIAAGGVTSGADIMELINLGADGVQMATRFVLSEECDVDDKFKQLFLDSPEENIVRIMSPVGLPARALSSPLTDRILGGTVEKPKTCISCLKHCSREFCIIKALEFAKNGDMEKGLFFTGSNLKKYNDIIPVKEIFDRLKKEAEEYIKKMSPTVG